MAKKVNLSVHKNKVAARRKRNLADALTRDTAKMIKENDIRAYAVVGIAANGEAHALWDTGNCMPLWAFPSVVGEVLRADVAGVEDEWRPDLPLKG